MPAIAIVTTMKDRGTPDDILLIEGLRAAGADGRLAAWDDPDEAWGFDAVVLRSTWGYHRDLSGFLSWLADIDRRGIVVLNHPDTVRANLDKARQFAWLDGLCVPRVPGVGIERAVTATELARQAARYPGAAAVVVKPTVSASGHQTVRLTTPVDRDAETTARVVRLIDEMVADGRGVILQPFVPEIADGELALVYFAGRLSHTLRRTPGVFTARRPAEPVAEPPAAAAAIAAAVLGSLDPIPAYARVDFVMTPDGPLLMEVELVEPWLGLEVLPAERRRVAVAEFAGAILGCYRAGRARG